MSQRVLTPPLDDATARSLNAGDRIWLTGSVLTTRDAAHKRLCQLLEEGKELPVDLRGQILYFTGPTPAPPGKPIGSAGPTTAGRMDPYSPMIILFSCAWCFIAWCWIIAFLGYAHKFLSFTNKLLSYANEAVLPFYILHQTVIVIVGYFVIQWQRNVYLKYLIVVMASFIGIMLLYELVKRKVVTRFIFGMRLKRK